MTAGIPQIQATATANASRGNHGYNAVVLTLLGGLLIETWYVQVGAGIAAHLVTALLVLVFGAIGLRRLRLSWPFVPGAKLTPGEFTPPNVLRCLLLLIIGSALPLLMHAGSATLLLLAAGAFGFIPWSKVAFYRAHPIASAAIFLIGAALGLFGAGAPVDLLIVPIATWGLWVTAAVLLLLGAREPAVPSALAAPSGQ